MGLFEEPLLHEIVRSFHDPDPTRAFRFRPFVYGSRSAPESTSSARSARQEGDLAVRLRTVRAAAAALPRCLAESAAAAVSPSAQSCC
jgi:hypothetical protein